MDMNSDSDLNSANYEIVNLKHYHTGPDVTVGLNEGTVREDKVAKRVQYPIQQKLGVAQWIVITIVLLISICALALSIGAFLMGKNMETS